MAAVYHTDAINKAQEEAEQVKVLMKENVNKVAERGEKLEDLQGRSETIEEETKTFSRNAKRVKRKYCCKNLKMSLCLIIVGLLAICAIAAIVVLVITKPWSQSGGHNPPVDDKNITKFGN